MTWMWVLVAIIAAFALGYMMFAPKRKTDMRNEHIEPVGMRNDGIEATSRMNDRRSDDDKLRRVA
jgi:hypothetical protein